MSVEILKTYIASCIMELLNLEETVMAVALLSNDIWSSIQSLIVDGICGLSSKAATENKID